MAQANSRCKVSEAGENEPADSNGSTPELLTRRRLAQVSRSVAQAISEANGHDDLDKVIERLIKD